MSSSSKYRVIEIMDEYSLIINYGTNDGAVKGDELRIIKVGESVKDPKSGQVLGTLDCIKETVFVEIPYENFSICRHSEIQNYNFLSPLTGQMSSFNYSKKNIKKLNVLSDDCTLRKLPEKTPVKVGDTVKVVGSR